MILITINKNVVLMRIKKCGNNIKGHLNTNFDYRKKVKHLIQIIKLLKFVIQNMMHNDMTVKSP